MHKHYLTPGPSELYYTVNDHIRDAMKIQVGSWSHRSKDFQGLFAHTRSQLLELLALPESTHLYFTSSATEIWERITQELVRAHSHHLVMGAFGQKFYQAAQSWGKTATSQTTAFETISVPELTDLLAITLNETSTGAAFPEDLLKAYRSANPNALIALDIVSAIPGVRLPWELVDTAYFSVQKAFGLPAGLGVWILSDRAYHRALELTSVGQSTYHNVVTLEKFAQKNQTPETPNVLGMYLLGKVAEDLNRRGRDILFSETSFKAASIYGVLDRHPILSAAIKNPAYRSKTTLVIESNEHTLPLTQQFAGEGLIVGSGYGDKAVSQIRLANFPVHSKELFFRVADLLENFT